MTKEEIDKLKQTIADFGRWYDKIGRVYIIRNEEKVLLLEKSIQYIEELENENAKLEAQIEKMKCPLNCENSNYSLFDDNSIGLDCDLEKYLSGENYSNYCIGCKNWKKRRIND